MNANAGMLNTPRVDAPAAGRLLLRILDHLNTGTLELITPDGTRLCYPGRTPGPRATLRVHDWAMAGRVLSRGAVGFAESYRDGHWSSPDLVRLLTLAAGNDEALRTAINGRWWSRMLYRGRHLLRPNSRHGSRRNIHAHYDIGNAFYRLWLDRSMTYSAALFREPGMALEDAQYAKYERILQRLEVLPRDHVLEIGCGWGGFAEYAARTRGCRVTALTLSREQAAWAQRRMRDAGVADRVSVEIKDYREATGRYDRVVSIEMFEAVGQAYWPGYFHTVRDRLRPGGRAMVQTITIAGERFPEYRRRSDFIQQYIFPGGMLPTRDHLETLTEEAGLFIAGHHAFGQDYAATLREWRTRFDAGEEAIRALGYGDAFVRLWRYYLAYCEAGFRTRRTDVLQLELWCD